MASYYISMRVAENLQANRTFYQDRGDDEGLRKFELWLFSSLRRIAAVPERGSQIAEMPSTHKRMRFEPAFFYYRTGRKDEVPLIYWIKWDGQGKNYRPSGLERIATEAAKERQSR